MRRTHIHFATELPPPLSPMHDKGHSRYKPKTEQSDTVISGMRPTCSTLMWVDLKRSALEGGVVWWRSRNGVILTDGVEKIIENHNGEEGPKKERVLEMKWVRWVEVRGGNKVLWGKKHSDWQEELKKGKDAVEQGLAVLSVEDKSAVGKVDKVEAKERDETDRNGIGEGGAKGSVKENWDD